MLRSGAKPGAGDGSHREGYAGPAAEHVAELRSLVEQRVEGDSQEIHEHQLDDRAKSRERRAHRCTEESHLADRRVADPLGAEPCVEPLRRSHDPAPGLLDSLVGASAAACDVLSQDDDVGIGRQGEMERLVDRLNHEKRSRHAHVSS